MNADFSSASAQLESAAEALSGEFSGAFAKETIGECLRSSYEALLPAAVPTYLPLLAHRFARERLLAALRSTDPELARTPLVLFVCTGNSGRSIMAAAMLQHAAGDSVIVTSAGTAPAEQVQPHVIEALRERGVDASAAFPKPLSEEVINHADVVVTMGCGDACPVIPGRRYLDWDLPDPRDQDLETVRRLRDSISDRVSVLLTELNEMALTTAGHDLRDPAEGRGHGT